MNNGSNAGGFVISNEFADSDLSCYAQAVYLQLRRRCSKDGTCYPSIRLLTQCCGIGSKDTTNKAIKELESSGWLIVVREKKKVNRYIVKRGA